MTPSLSNSRVVLVIFIYTFLLLLNVVSINETCETGGYITHLYWNDIDIPLTNYKMEYDLDSLSVTFDLDLPYLGSSYLTDINSTMNDSLGTTYILDFGSLLNVNIEQAGKCQNRMASDFESTAFKEFWGYSETPNINGHLGSKEYLAYPPPSLYWDLTTINCSYINYYGEFSWFDLMGCSDYDDMIRYNQIIINNDWINLTGTFYVDIISPINLEIDSGNYEIYKLLDIPFIISVKNSINIISATGTNLFILSIIDIFMSDNDNNIDIILLTESSDDLIISSPFLLKSPFSNNIDIDINQAIININTECLNTNHEICSQVWKISITNHVNDNNINLSGIYGIRFDVDCNPYIEDTEQCNSYLNTNDQYVGLTTNLNYNYYRYQNDVELEAFMSFYSDSTFQYETELDKDYKIDETVYFEIKIDPSSSSSTQEIANIKIENVWLCSIDSNSDLTPLKIINSEIIGGNECLSSVDSIHIIKNGEINSLLNNNDIDNILLYSVYDANNIIRLSFNMNDAIDTDSLYIHTQLNINIGDSDSDNEYSLFKHYISNIIIISTASSSSITDEFSLKQLIAIVLGENVLCFFLCCFMILFWRKCKQKQLEKDKRARRNKRHLARAKTLSSMGIPVPSPISDDRDGMNSVRTRSRSHTPTHSVLKGQKALQQLPQHQTHHQHQHSSQLPQQHHHELSPNENPFLTRAQTFSHAGRDGGIQLTQRRISISSLQQLQQQLQQQVQQQRSKGESNSLPHSISMPHTSSNNNNNVTRTPSANGNQSEGPNPSFANNSSNSTML